MGVCRLGRRMVCGIGIVDFFSDSFDSSHYFIQRTVVYPSL